MEGTWTKGAARAAHHVRHGLSRRDRGGLTRLKLVVVWDISGTRSCLLTCVNRSLSRRGMRDAALFDHKGHARHDCEDKECRTQRCDALCIGRCNRIKLEQLLSLLTLFAPNGKLFEPKRHKDANRQIRETEY